MTGPELHRSITSSLHVLYPTYIHTCILNLSYLPLYTANYLYTCQFICDDASDGSLGRNIGWEEIREKKPIDSLSPIITLLLVDLHYLNNNYPFPAGQRHIHANNGLIARIRILYYPWLLPLLANLGGERASQP